MRRASWILSQLLICWLQAHAFSFLLQPLRGGTLVLHPSSPYRSTKLHADESSNNELSVLLDPQLTDERTKSLFAWISRAFVGDEEYNNLMLAMAAIFGTNLPPNSLPVQLVERGE